MNAAGLGGKLLVAKLPSPYRFNPRTIAYNFGLGWITPPDPSDVFEVVDDNVESWIGWQRPAF